MWIIIFIIRLQYLSLRLQNFQQQQKVKKREIKTL